MMLALFVSAVLLLVACLGIYVAAVLLLLLDAIHG